MDISPSPLSGGNERARDVVIIGDGAAGLAAASVLAGRDLLVLDEAGRLGGRLHSIPGPDGSWINLGAHLLTGGHVGQMEQFREELTRHVHKPPGWRAAARIQYLPGGAL